MKEKFNKKEYDIKYHKENKTPFKVDLNKDERNELDEILKEIKLTKAQFLRNAIDDLKGEYKMIIYKKNKIDETINKIIENAINDYTNDFEDEGSIIDWKEGYKKDIRTTDGRIKKYISYKDFKDLYGNFKYDLDQLNSNELDKVIKYLNDEINYTDYDNLDRELYMIEDFKEI